MSKKQPVSSKKTQEVKGTEVQCLDVDHRITASNGETHTTLRVTLDVDESLSSDKMLSLLLQVLSK